MRRAAGSGSAAQGRVIGELTVGGGQVRTVWAQPRSNQTVTVPRGSSYDPAVGMRVIRPSTSSGSSRKIRGPLR